MRAVEYATPSCERASALRLVWYIHQSFHLSSPRLRPGLTEVARGTCPARTSAAQLSTAQSCPVCNTYHSITYRSMRCSERHRTLQSVQVSTRGHRQQCAVLWRRQFLPLCATHCVRDLLCASLALVNVAHCGAKPGPAIGTTDYSCPSIYEI